MKIVKESIRFERGDPYGTLGIGSRVLIEKWAEEKLDGFWGRKIEGDKIYYYGNALMWEWDLMDSLPHYIKFGFIKGNVWAHHCRLKTLRGFPPIIGGDLDIENNIDLKSLEGGPEEIGGNLHLHNTGLTSLKGFPKRIGTDKGIEWNHSIQDEGSPRAGEIYVGKDPYFIGPKGLNIPPEDLEDELRKICQFSSLIFNPFFS